MAVEEPQRGNLVKAGYKRLKLSFFEQAMIGAMLLALAIASLDALDGQRIGKGDNLTVAKLQGQQELMASTSK